MLQGTLEDPHDEFFVMREEGADEEKGQRAGKGENSLAGERETGAGQNQLVDSGGRATNRHGKISNSYSYSNQGSESRHGSGSGSGRGIVCTSNWWWATYRLREGAIPAFLSRKLAQQVFIASI